MSACLVCVNFSPTPTHCKHTQLYIVVIVTMLQNLIIEYDMAMLMFAVLTQHASCIPAARLTPLSP